MAGRVLILLLCCLPVALAQAREAPVEISADHLLVEEKERRATYSGHVELSQGNLKVMADKLVVAGGVGATQKVVATGKPVRMQQLDRRGEGDELVYDPQGDVITLTGNARIWQGQDVVSGERVVYSIKTQRIEVGRGEQGRVKSVFYPKRGTPETQ